ncbi:Inorganic phosphate transporter PHO84 [Fusarium oxysporum f. sp. albedinis]|nr:Calpain-type cysteine protease ADL1 [Fusarium oxysporum f. sp. albedinis]KAJ0138386.1 Inorganic phosphate transporter PHO84 [Fusarium oxysporum f. sp. albedinis]
MGAKVTQNECSPKDVVQNKAESSSLWRQLIANTHRRKFLLKDSQSSKYQARGVMVSRCRVVPTNVEQALWQWGLTVSTKRDLIQYTSNLPSFDFTMHMLGPSSRYPSMLLAISMFLPSLGA